MNLLLIEHEMRPAALLEELCRGSVHRLQVCRTASEAAEIWVQQEGEIDWIIINGIPTDAGADLVGVLLATGCQAPVVYLSAGEGNPAGEKLPGAVASRQRLSRLDLHRLLTQPGGAFACGEPLFEYHAPHPCKVPVSARRKRRDL
jgi:hypothetical protein